MISNFLYVGLGGALGAMLRYGIIQHIVVRVHPSPFPIGTMLVNVLGAIAIGIVLSKYQHDAAKLLLVTGVLGGFTTFSAFSWDAWQLMQQGQQWQSIAYVVGSVVLCILGVFIGTRIAGVV